jgi:transposase
MNTEELVKAFQEERQENERLRQELATSQEVIAQLTARIEHLEGQRAKDSHTSSKPPSTDGLIAPVRKTQSLREKSGKKSGGQPGHPGNTWMLVEQPDQTVLLTPEQCQHCRQDLSQVAHCRRERVQVFDLPTLHLHVTQYHGEVKACPCCQAETRADLPEGITLACAQYGPQVKTLAVYLACLHLLPLARVCQILSDLFGTTFSQARVLAACQESARAIPLLLKRIKTALQTSPVVHNDETGLRVEKKRWWLHVAATCWFTLYLAHPKRGKEATEAMEILPHFLGTSVHDSLSSSLQYGCIHALCVVH